MQTKLSAFAAKVIESGWLAALIIVPLLFNIYTERVFEEDKIPLMRSIAVVILLALLIGANELRRRWRSDTHTGDGSMGGTIRAQLQTLTIGDRPFWKVPMVVPALVLASAYILSTLFSIVPHISLWGAYIRRQGAYTWLSYVTIFFALLLLVRQRKQVERVITVALLTSLPAALYGVLQHFGRDPLPWGGDVVERVSSVAGNPIFIGAYMIMVIPLTLVRVIEHFGRLVEEPAPGEPPPNYLAPSLLAGAYLFLLIVQFVTVIYSQSRGPLIGLGAGLTFFFIVFFLRRRMRWLTLGITGLAVAGLVFLAVFNLPNSPLEPLRDVKYIGRLGRVFELEGGTGKVRVLIWEGATSLLAANPARSIFGYGPEAMYVAYNPYYPPDLAHYEARNASPDRSHNETFDSLVMTGVFGFVAQTSFFLLLFHYILGWLGMINSRAQRITFFGLAIMGGVLGALIPYFVDGSFRFAGVGLPAGISMGLITYLLGYAVTHLNQETHEEHPHSLLLIGLLAGVISHYVEVHFGIAIGATRLYFWVYAALAVVIGVPLLQGAGQLEAVVAGAPGAVASRRDQRRRDQRRRALNEPKPLLTGSLLGLSLLEGLVLIVMSFSFYTPTFDLSAKNFALLWLFLGTWLFGALVVVAESAFEQDEEGRWLERLGVYVVTSLATWMLFAVIYFPWVNWQPGGGQITIEQLREIASHLANTVTVLYVYTMLVIGVTALAFLREESLPAPFTSQAGWQPMILYPLMALSVVPIIVSTNLDISRADILSKQGAGYERAGQWDAAQILYQEALRLQPQEDRYFLNQGRALMEKARTLTQQARSATDEQQRTLFLQQRDNFLQEALKVLKRAQATNPLNTDHTRNLASLHRVWTTLIDDPNAREQHLDEANSYYQQAVTLSPHNAALWNDWAALLIDRGRYAEAEAKIARSLELDALFIDTYLLQANLAVQQQDFEKALAAYEGALKVSSRSLPALSGKAYALAQLERTDEAIEANKKAIEVSPNDFISHRNLALLYQQTGQYELAINEAQAALSLAGEGDKPALQNFILQLQNQRTAAAPGG